MERPFLSYNTQRIEDAAEDISSVNFGCRDYTDWLLTLWPDARLVAKALLIHFELGVNNIEGDGINSAC